MNHQDSLFIWYWYIALPDKLRYRIFIFISLLIYQLATGHLNHFMNGPPDMLSINVLSIWWQQLVQLTILSHYLFCIILHWWLINCKQTLWMITCITIFGCIIVLLSGWKGINQKCCWGSRPWGPQLTKPCFRSNMSGNNRGKEFLDQ